MSLLILAPHQDDEILCAGGLIQKCLALNVIVEIVFATNGDYCGKEIAALRWQESRAAILSLGVNEQHIHYLGYGDTGMRASHSFLKKLWEAEETHPFSTPVSCQTYHPGKLNTVHQLHYGVEAFYTRANFMEDLNRILQQCNPTTILVPNSADAHGDHWALARFFHALPSNAAREKTLTYLIHGGDDSIWPDDHPDTAFSRPPAISETCWSKRISVPLSKEQIARKREALSLFETQGGIEAGSFLAKFSRPEEIFFSDS